MEEFNADEMHHPAWMDKLFFENVLCSYEQDDSIKIKKLNITPGSGKNDHFASIMFRIVAEYSSRSTSNNSKSMIIKTSPDAEGFKKQMLEKSHIFETEIGMYEELSKFEKVLRNHGDTTQLCPKLLYHSLEPRPVIILEDLVPQGYSCLRDRSITIDEVKACLSKLAKWHAVSYKLGMEGDESVKKYQVGMLSTTSDEMPDFVTGSVKRLINSISKTEGLELCAEKLQAIEPKIIAKGNELFTAYSRGQKAIMVLNHGDFHSKNVMFKFDNDGNYEDVLLIDFQLSCYAPSVIDITYSIFMLLTEEHRHNHREELIYFYFSTFVETLKNIRYDGELPTLADFYIEMYRYKEFELWVMATFLPIICTVQSQAKSVDFEKLLSSSDAISMMYLNPNLIREFKLLLPKYLHKGYLG